MQDIEKSAEDVLEFWFPDNGHQNSPELHSAFWNERMQGGMDVAIIDRFAELTLAGAKGRLDSWAVTARGRLALLIVLDQFSRSLWRGTPAAYAQDIKAAKLSLKGLQNGHFDALAPWEQAFFTISISHCEGPDHLERMIKLSEVVEGIISRMPNRLAPLHDLFRARQVRVEEVVAKFGRHPHRNDILGRNSTLEEEHYLSTGEFPHNNPGIPETV